MDPWKSVAHEYEAGTGYRVGDRVWLGRTAFAPPGAEGVIVGVDVDLRDVDGHASSDPCFRVRLRSGSVVYVTLTDLVDPERA